jgi:hypothetical protein
MAGKYFFNGTDINNIIDTTGGTTVSNYYSGFPPSNITSYPTIELPLPFSYTDNSNNYGTTNDITNTNSRDLSNRCKLKPNTYTSTANVTVPKGAKFISGYCVGASGGGGGGGGGGGDGFGKQNDGGNGGIGGAGNYSAVVQYALSSDITNVDVTVGTLGNGGAGGNDSNNSGGNNGSSGVSGNASSIQVGSEVICTAPGGRGGSGGGSGNKNSNGGNGASGANGDSGKYSSSAKTGVNIYSNLYPPSSTTGGNGGTGGNNDGNSGSPGVNGRVVLYFLYS